MNSDYYRNKLSADRLKRVYDIATPRVNQYLEAEIEYVKSFIKPGMHILELGSGYGRVLKELANDNISICGLDNSFDSLVAGREYLKELPSISLLCGDASMAPYGVESFDLVVCIQNGISAFHVDQKKLVDETVRITKPGGTILFSSYSENFWDDRLAWFELQAQEGLLGPIDYDKTGGGEIVCTDGFTATTLGREDFRRLTGHLEAEVEITEVDQSSLFCVIRR